MKAGLELELVIKAFHEDDHYSDSEASSHGSADSAIGEGAVEPVLPPVVAGSKRCRKKTQLYNPQLDGANDTVRRGGAPPKKKQKKDEKAGLPFEVDMVESDMLPSGER